MTLLPDAEASSHPVGFFPATRAHGLERLRQFLPAAGRAYAASRNTDFGPERRDNVSCLSPFIRHRLLSEEEVAQAAHGAHGFKGAEKFIQEVYWRTYFKGWLEARPHVWSLYRDAVPAAMSGLTAAEEERYSNAVGARTDIECFNHWANELIETGYLHNHARMWFASIWIFTLKLPWVLGADFFYRHLLDGDAASNTLSWRWVAGLHTKGKHYVAKASNINTYTEGRFSPDGQLATSPEPLHDDWNRETAPGRWPTPLGDLLTPGGPCLLLLHEDDLGAALNVEGVDVAAVAVLGGQAERSPFAMGEAVGRFAQEAAADAAERHGSQLVASVEGVVEFAQKEGVRTILTPYAPVGPGADRLARLQEVAKAAGVAIHDFTRPHDLAAWPHCTKGFFALKKKLPGLLG